jgi:hypothetical protein
MCILNSIKEWEFLLEKNDYIYLGNKLINHINLVYLF